MQGNLGRLVGAKQVLKTSRALAYRFGAAAGREVRCSSNALLILLASFIHAKMGLGIASENVLQ